MLLSARKWVVAKLQGDKSAPQSSMELYYPWISGPLRVSWAKQDKTRRDKTSQTGEKNEEKDEGEEKGQK